MNKRQNKKQTKRAMQHLQHDQKPFTKKDAHVLRTTGKQTFVNKYGVGIDEAPAEIEKAVRLFKIIAEGFIKLVKVVAKAVVSIIRDISCEFNKVKTGETRKEIDANERVGGHFEAKSLSKTKVPEPESDDRRTSI